MSRHALDFTSADRVLFSTDYSLPPARSDGDRAVLGAIPYPADRTKIASDNAEALFRLA